MTKIKRLGKVVLETINRASDGFTEAMRELFGDL